MDPREPAWSAAWSRTPPAIVQDTGPPLTFPTFCANLLRRTATPRDRSIRSVWSRVATASRTVVSPSAPRPASRIADLTWALGTRVV